VAIGCVELGQIHRDDSLRNIDGYYDFRVGDFIVTDQKKQHTCTT